jgi:hypothetical protein
MFDTFLVPEKTVVTAKGDGASVDVSSVPNRTFLLLLNITTVIEQESLDVSVWGSADEKTWGSKPLASFPQKFYCGEHPLLLDLAGQDDVKFIRAHWEVNRWGRGSEQAMFEFSLKATEVTPEMLRETASR